MPKPAPLQLENAPKIDPTKNPLPPRPLTADVVTVPITTRGPSAAIDLAVKTYLESSGDETSSLIVVFSQPFGTGVRCVVIFLLGLTPLSRKTTLEKELMVLVVGTRTKLRSICSSCVLNTVKPDSCPIKRGQKSMPIEKLNRVCDCLRPTRLRPFCPVSSASVDKESPVRLARLGRTFKPLLDNKKAFCGGTR